ILLDRKGIRTLITLILIFALVFLIYVTRFIFQPVGAYLAAIAVPIIGAGIIFYITNPLVNWLEKKKLPRIIGVFIIFLLIALAITIVVLFVAPIVQKQFSNFVDSVPNMVNNTEKLFNMWQENQEVIPPQFEETIQGVIDNFNAEKITTGIIGTIGQIFSF